MKTLKNNNSVLVVLVIVALLSLPVASAENIKPKNQIDLDVQTQFREILSLLQPVNVIKVDQVSKELFKDFFEQKDKIYGYTATTPQAEGHVAPAKLRRQTF